MRLLGISGSLRARSANTSVVQAAVRLVPEDVKVMLYGGLGDLPHFNPDLDGDEPPPPVAELRRAVGASDGLLICSPEYARGVAGVMKNGLDWLVASSEFPGKPVALINASPRATHADTSLRLTLATMSARLVDEASISLPLLGRNLDADGIVDDPALAAPLRDALAAFVSAIRTRTA